MMLTFRSVPYLETASIWPECAELMYLGLAQMARFYTAGDIQSRLATAVMQLWVAEDDCGKVRMACVTQVESYPQCKALAVVLVGGEGFGLWREWRDDLLRCAREMGCPVMLSHGARDGWERSAGMHKIGVAYMMETKEIADA